MDADGPASRRTASNDRVVRACDAGARSARLGVGAPMSIGGGSSSAEARTDRSRAIAASSAHARGRPQARGKFVFAGDEKVYLRGVVYGAFRPDANGREYQDVAAIERDFALMHANGLNAVRIPHTMPPRSVLDAARRHGLWVMAGLSAEQYIGFLIDRKKTLSEIEALVRSKVRECAGHPALLCYALGNEIPASIARWLGRRTVERYLKGLYRAVKAEDPAGLVTYVNYPTTEYLQLPFLDLLCFNVYLESRSRFDAYLDRLQNLAGNRPLLMSELGLDSLRNREAAQATSLDWQVRTAFPAGCPRAFAFPWTDEWYRGAGDVDDWAFGLTRADRSPKPALAAARRAFGEAPFAPDVRWPRISVIVCTYNGARTIRDCLEALNRLTYADYEVIVVDDGSTDTTAAIARRYDCRLIQTENRGLASARNTGLRAASGEIVAYIDDDAYPDPEWLTYLANRFLSAADVGVGGPNIAPAGDGRTAECVARAPGGPVHVLLSDREAEHIPGCNMAFRKESLEAIGGFDPQFRVAGDDVDVCWRLQERKWTLGFSAGAVVWHHARRSVRAYWKQQSGYGRAEAMLERKWPEKYNASGHMTWSGRLYGQGLPQLLGRGRIYHGQPLARLRGRLQFGLTPWRRRGTAGLALPLPRTAALWSERWLDLDQRLRTVEARLKTAGAAARRGGAFEHFDLEVRGGLLGAVRLLVAAEDHSGGAQLIRFRWWPRCSYGGLALAAVFA